VNTLPKNKEHIVRIKGVINRAVWFSLVS